MERKHLNRAYVEIGNICNLACSFCPGTRRAPRQMTPEEFRVAASRLAPEARYLYLHVMGEPLLHPHLDAILSIASEYGFRVCITTNGVLLSGGAGETLLRHADALHKVSVSLHSAEGNGVEIDHAGYLKGAIDFSKRASDVGIYTVFRLWNLDEGGRKGRNAENEAIEARLRRAFSAEWTPRPNGFRLDRNIFLEYAGIFTWPVESDACEQDDGYCHGLLDQIAVLADGTVVPCCLDSEGEIALGNLFDTPLSEILASARAREMREGLLKGRFVEPLCKKCTYARRFSR